MEEGKNRGVSVHSKLTAVSSRPVDPGKTHPLSALDHAMGLHSLHIIFYYEKNPFGIFDLDPLRVSLSEVLSSYPLVTGRLIRGERSNWEVKCNDAGVRVFRASVGVTLHEWLRSAGGNEERDLTVWEGIPEDPSTWSPFRLQVNEFEGGGVAIGLSCTHMNADVTSAVMMFKAWSETHRGMVIEHPPLFKPSILCDRSSAANARAKSVINYAAKAKAKAHAPLVKMATATFKFSNSTIEQCLNEMHDKCPEATPFDFLAALFWIRIARLMAPKQDNHHSLSICLDFRRRVQPPIPLGYFGNALHFSHLSLNAEERACSDLGKVVELLHNHVSGITEEEFWSGIDWLKSRKDGGEKYSPPFNMYGPELTCVSMEHMITGHQSLMNAAIFENNQKPVHVSFHVGNVEGDGLIVVMPSTEGGLARTVSVKLPSNELAELCKDQALLRLEPATLLCGGT